jgi:hypothetical protein
MDGARHGTDRTETNFVQSLGQSFMTTIIERANFLWDAGQRAEAIQILEDFIPSACADIAEDGSGQITYVYRSWLLPAAIERLRSFHYACAQYADPATGVKAGPEARIKHLNRILELGFRFGYILKFLAEAYHDLGDDERAQAYLVQAWEVDPNLTGAVRISRSLGLSAPPKSLTPPNSDEPTLISLISPKWSHVKQVPTETQIHQWVNDSRWDLIIEFSNPADYARKILPKARSALRLIATCLGECDNNQNAREALCIMLSSFYWDIRDAAINSLSKIGDEDTLSFLTGLSAGNSTWRERLRNAIAHLQSRVLGKVDGAMQASPHV